MNRSMILVLLATLLLFGSVFVVLAQDTVTYEAIAVTGTNRLRGVPIMTTDNFGELGAPGVGAFEDGADNPSAITTDTPGDALLATIADPDAMAQLADMAAAAGFPPPPLPDPSLVNLPLRLTPFIVDPAGSRGPMSDSFPGNQLLPTATTLNDPITLDMWLSAAGQLSVACDGMGGAAISIEMQNMIPHGIYTVWAMYDVPGGPVPVFNPWGGAPAAFVPGSNGDALFERTLPYCPLELEEGQFPLLWIEIVFHSDGGVYGAVSDLTFQGLPGGIIIHPQLDIPITAELLD